MPFLSPERLYALFCLLVLNYSNPAPWPFHVCVPMLWLSAVAFRSKPFHCVPLFTFPLFVSLSLTSFYLNQTSTPAGISKSHIIGLGLFAACGLALQVLLHFEPRHLLCYASPIFPLGAYPSTLPTGDDIEQNRTVWPPPAHGLAAGTVCLPCWYFRCVFSSLFMECQPAPDVQTAVQTGRSGRAGDERRKHD